MKHLRVKKKLLKRGMPMTKGSWTLQCPRAGLTEKPEEKANLAAGLDILGGPSFREVSDGDGLGPHTPSAELCSFSQSWPLPKHRNSRGCCPQATVASADSYMESCPGSHQLGKEGQVRNG